MVGRAVRGTCLNRPGTAQTTPAGSGGDPAHRSRPVCVKAAPGMSGVCQELGPSRDAY